MDRSRRCRLRAAFALLPALAAPAGPARSEWRVDTEAGAVHDTNIGRGQLEQDIRSDSAATFAATVRRYWVPYDRGVLSFGASASGAGYARYQGLDHADAGLSAAYRYKLGVGREAPWVSVHASLDRLDYRSSLRNGWIRSVGVGAGKRFGENLDVRADYGHESRTSDEDTEVVPGISGAAFAQRNDVVAVDADYSLSEATALSFGYTRRRGDVTPTTQRNLQIFEASTAIAADPAFGVDWFAYRLPATTHLFFLGVSRALGPHSALNVGIERQVSRGIGGNDYYDTQSRISIDHQF